VQIPRCWLLLALLVACDGESFSQDVPINATVSAAGIASVLFETEVGLDVRGLRRVDDVTITATITLTTSSTESLQLAENAFGLETDRNGSELRVALVAPGGVGFDFEQARLSGVLGVSLPDDVDLSTRVIGGGVRARDMDGDLDLRAAGPVTADPVRGDAAISAGSGGAFVRTELSSGADVRVQVELGDLELILPVPLSARVQATALAGSIVLQHPNLPLRPSGRPYEVIIGGGAASVTALTRRGDILLRN